MERTANDDDLDGKINRAFGIEEGRHRGNKQQRQNRKALERDGKCRDCGSTENLTVHHLIPRSQSGTNKLCNLITLCRTCHVKRHPELKSGPGFSPHGDKGLVKPK